MPQQAVAGPCLDEDMVHSVALALLSNSGKPKSFPILKYQVTHCAWDCCTPYVLCTGYPWPDQHMLAQACVIPGTAPQPLLSSRL